MLKKGAHIVAAAALLSGAAFGPTDGRADSSDGEPAAWIEVERAEGAVTLQIYARLAPGQTGRYQLTTQKTGGGGSSTVRQGGVVPSDRTGDAAPLASSRISLGEDATLVADLLVIAETGEEIRDHVEISED